ncbi:type II secretion system protein [Uliginosibacterium sp. H3]|uniref:Type II secretion system protein n=1 Tax=Uliginosibacterium silvisoli TaxID=3114758 RepID=A0ABU6K5Q1_9RHOO|nr:type II secretion system protein [Uliginosibacterium sp. H3]
MLLLKAPAGRHDAGFTLVEIAIALLVIMLLAGGAISALRAQTAYTRISQTREQLREAREALLSYAVTNQALPCVAATSDGNAAPQPCPTSKGFLPWRTLGLPSADVWGQPLRYAASPGMAGSAGFGFATLGTLKVLSGGANIDANASGAGTYGAIAFAVWSIGEDAVDASANDLGATPQIDNTTVVAAVAGSDDVLEWVSRYALFGRMTTAGRPLPLSSYSSSSSSAGP